jgi:hypothetical protein
VMNSENFDVRIMWNGALDKKIWALEACRGKTVFSGGSGVVLEFLSGWRVFGTKDSALAEFGKILGIFVDFWSVWRGSGPICNYFLEAEDPAINFPNAQGLRHHLHQVQGLLCKFCRNIIFWNYFPMVKSVDWVHGVMDRRRGRFMVDQGLLRHETWRCVTGAPGAAGLRSSPTEAGEGEDDDAMLMRGSPGHDRQ